VDAGCKWGPDGRGDPPEQVSLQKKRVSLYHGGIPRRIFVLSHHASKHGNKYAVPRKMMLNVGMRMQDDTLSLAFRQVLEEHLVGNNKASKSAVEDPLVRGAKLIHHCSTHTHHYDVPFVFLSTSLACFQGEV
jgi:hypothetical protein